MKIPICLVITFSLMLNLTAQTLFVDPLKGNDQADGSYNAPLATLGKALSSVSLLKDSSIIKIKLFPGLYLLNDKLELQAHQKNDSGYLSIESVYMPDDQDWDPSKMPVIQSLSVNNSTSQFPHSVGFLVARNNVRIKGLKFVGNPNPFVKYYYPITREDTLANGLEISQCYFLGDRYSTPIQGAIWAHGERTIVDHCIFYECKNALLLFKNIKNFALTSSIIYGAYEAAVWFGPFISDFNFSNNIITTCNFFWVRPENTFPKYKFASSLITNNKYFMGFYAKKGLMMATKNNHIEVGIKKSGRVVLNAVTLDGLYKGYLNLSDTSDGQELQAGLFKIKR